MIQIGKNYTVQEIKDLMGADYFKKFYRPFDYAPKPKITAFNDMDAETQKIYLQIKNYIQQLNPDKQVQVWASGSRVKGTWKTKEESDAFAALYNCKPKYSDYDFLTDAPNQGNLKELSERIGVHVDCAGGDTKVLIV